MCVYASSTVYRVICSGRGQKSVAAELPMLSVASGGGSVCRERERENCFS